MGLFSREKKRPTSVESIANMSERLSKFHPSTRLNMYDEEFDKNDEQRKDYRKRAKGHTKRRKRAIIDNI